MQIWKRMSRRKKFVSTDAEKQEVVHAMQGHRGKHQGQQEAEGVRRKCGQGKAG